MKISVYSTGYGLYIVGIVVWISKDEESHVELEHIKSFNKLKITNNNLNNSIIYNIIPIFYDRNNNIKNKKWHL